jgi:hypothetical protein
MGDIEGRRDAMGAGWMDGAGFQVRGDEEEVGVTGIHFEVLVAGFFACLACRWVTSRAGKMVQVLDAQMGVDFEVGVMRRRYG